MNDWKKYPGDRLAFQHESDFYVIKPSADPPHGSIPVFCKICEGIMMSEYDEKAHQKFGCCDACANAWAYPRNAEWINGWRPSVEEVQKFVASRGRG
jgi:hypothetical protein